MSQYHGPQKLCGLLKASFGQFGSAIMSGALKVAIQNDAELENLNINTFFKILLPRTRNRANP